MGTKRVVLLRSNPVSPDPPVEKVANTLLARGYEVTILGWDRGSDEKEMIGSLPMQNGEAKIVRFGIPAVFGGGLKKTLKPLAVFEHRLFRWLTKHRSEYDIIHAFDFDTGLAAKSIAGRYGKKLVYHILDFYVASHTLPSAKLREYVKRAEFSVINQADCTIICTEKRYEQIQGSCPRQVEVIHNTPKPMDEVVESVALDSSADRCRIVYVGILSEARLLREMMEAVQQDERLELHIGGFGVLENEIKEAANNCARIVFYGKLPYAKTLALEQACDVMTAIYDPKVPNHRYAAPNKFYESLMLGKPIIMARNTGFDEIITDNNIGCLIDFNTEGLKAGFDELLAKKKYWPEMGQKSRALYDNFYSWSIMEERLNAVYDRL